MFEVREITIRNQEFLDALEKYKDVLMEKVTPDGEPLVARSCPRAHATDDPNQWVSHEYMHKIINMGRGHLGFPAALGGFSGLKHEGESAGKNINIAGANRIKDASSALNSKIIQLTAARNNALNACYPPKGFIAWHNNANASGYNIIITWSENGDGYWEHYDIDKKEVVRIQDQPGWQAKMTYFGPYDYPDKLCYHAAYTDCYRITVAFVFAEADTFWEEVIEDIETPS